LNSLRAIMTFGGVALFQSLFQPLIKYIYCASWM